MALSKNAKAYHPSSGVYRSSYKNARRLAATETNIAYRTADYERMQQADYIVGIRVQLSNNHTLNGKAFTDICDQLSAPHDSKEIKGRGCYPKNFKFTGWHPLCRCFVTTILKSEKELAEDFQRMLRDEKPSSESVNSVNGYPKEFTQWITDHREQIAKAQERGTLPYFIKDNQEAVDGILGHKKIKSSLASELGSNITNADRLLVDNENNKIQKQCFTLDDVSQKAMTKGIEYREPKLLGKPLTDEEIIDKLISGDKVCNACSSLAFAYAANKGGLDVTDYRGGNSLNFFGTKTNVNAITRAVGGYHTYSDSEKIWGKISVGNEYILAYGSHVAIVKKIAFGKFQYLELQSPIKSGNNWYPLTKNTLSSRFYCDGRTHWWLIDISKLYKLESYRTLMGYLNTQGMEKSK